MRTLITLALIGAAAQLIDGALGMAYGVTATTLLLSAGTTPATASASVHLAEIGTTFASAIAHTRFGNVNWRVVIRIGVPGAAGAFVGASVLSALSTDAAGPWMAGILLTIGGYLLIRFSRPIATTPARPARARFLAPLGLFAGFIDATGGGGWGPVATPTLLASGRMSPRHVVGSVDAAEFGVSIAASVGFLLSLGTAGFAVPTVIALFTGGLIAAPLAAWLVRVVPAQLLGAAVGGLIVMTNTRTLLRVGQVTGGPRTAVYTLIGAAWVTALLMATRLHRRTASGQHAG